MFWDKECLPLGLNWEEGFLDGLIKSRAFVCIMSRRALKQRFEDLKLDSWCDNVLLEVSFS